MSLSIQLQRNMPNKTKQCIACEKTLSRNEVGICKKLLGANIEHFYCLECLAQYLECEVEELKAKIEEFKAAGCKLFG